MTTGTTGEFQPHTSAEMIEHIDDVLEDVGTVDVGLFAPDMDELSPDEVDEILQRDVLPMTKVQPLGKVTLQNKENGWPFVSDGYHHPTIPGGYGR